MDEQNVTTKEAAALLGISTGRIRQLVLAVDLPAEKFGRDLMIKLSDLACVKVYGKRGRPSKKQTADSGKLSTATDAPDDGAPAAAIGEENPAKPAKKSRKKGGGSHL